MNATSTKILRACVVQGGRVIDEQRLDRRIPLTIGHAPKNTFVVPDGDFPKSHELFSVENGTYELVLSEDMRGKLSIDNNAVDFSALKSQGMLKKKGDFYTLPLNDNHRGKVLIGDLTVIFQFVAPPPEPPKIELADAVKGAFWKTVDWNYIGILLTIILIEIPTIIWFQHAPRPKEVTLETMDERWANLIAPELKRDEVKKPEKPKEDDGVNKKAKEKEKAQEKQEEPTGKEAAAHAKAKAVRSAKIRESIAGKGILAILGTTGKGSASGAVADVLGEGGIGGDLDSAFEGISGVGLAGGGQRTSRGGGSGEAASIGGLATSGGGQVGLGGKQEARVGSVKTEAPEVDGSLDPDAIAKVVSSRKRMVQDCYEKELKRDSGLSGKIEVEITIGEDGNVEDARVAKNGVGSEAVGSCIVSRIRRWRFPKPERGSVTVNLPFIFTPSS